MIDSGEVRHRTAPMMSWSSSDAVVPSARRRGSTRGRTPSWDWKALSRVLLSTAYRRRLKTHSAAIRARPLTDLLETAVKAPLRGQDTSDEDHRGRVIANRSLLSGPGGGVLMAASGLAVLLRIGWRLSDISGFDIRLRGLLIRVPFWQAVRLPVRVARGNNVRILNWFVRCRCHGLTSTQTRRANAIPGDAQNRRTSGCLPQTACATPSLLPRRVGRALRARIQQASK